MTVIFPSIQKKMLIIILYMLAYFPSSSSSSSSSSSPSVVESGVCLQSCGGISGKDIPFPFGFSSGCKIQVNCTTNGTMVIGDFPIQEIRQDYILVDLRLQCRRSIEAIRDLFGPNYAPTSNNVILMDNCIIPLAFCMIPWATVQNHFQLLDCGSKDNNTNLSCYSERNTQSLFITYDNLIKSGCNYLFSSIFESELSLNASVVQSLQTIQLGWWLQGDCRCSEHANCTTLTQALDGKPGYRCQCLEGYVGDGYIEGSGCRRGSGGGGSNIARKRFIGFGLATLVLIFCVILFLSKRKKKVLNLFMFRRKTKEHLNLEAFLKQCGSLAPIRYPYSDIKRMTMSFKEKLGEGGYGSVYKGKLSDGRLVAVKILKLLEGDGEEFINEVSSICRTSHVNIVTFIGFCLEREKRALVYEYMPNGSLEKFIHGKNSVGCNQLDMDKLHQICLGVAQGLHYLHRGCNTRILHFDIKPHNILLDEDFCPKISDFGLAKQCTNKDSIVSIVDIRGTIGYIAPELVSRHFGGVSYKSDVYSYGMMILEIVGRRKNVSSETSHSSEVYFPYWAYQHLVVDNDLRLKGVVTPEADEIAKKIILVGLWCIQNDPSLRPTMSKVIEMLEGEFRAIPMPPKAFFGSPSTTPHSSSITTLVAA